MLGLVQKKKHSKKKIFFEKTEHHPRVRAHDAYAHLSIFRPSTRTRTVRVRVDAKFHLQPKTRELGLHCANIGPKAQVYARVRALGAYAHTILSSQCMRMHAVRARVDCTIHTPGTFTRELCQTWADIMPSA